MISTERLLLRIPEAAEALGVSRAYCYELLTAGEIPVVRLGRSVRIPAKALQDWVQQHQSSWSGEEWASHDISSKGPT